MAALPMDIRNKTPEEQARICKKHGLEPVLPEDLVALALSSLGQRPVHGARVALPENGTISWFIHCGEFSDADDFYQSVHTDHLQTMLPLVLKYLQLPPGTRFIVDDDGYEDVWQEDPHPQKPTNRGG